MCLRNVYNYRKVSDSKLDKYDTPQLVYLITNFVFLFFFFILNFDFDSAKRFVLGQLMCNCGSVNHCTSGVVVM